MGRNNRKKKNRNNASNTGGNIQNNTIPDVATTATATGTATTATTMRFTRKQLGFSKQQMKKINQKYGLKGYPKSMEFASGYKHYFEHEDNEAFASFQIGAETVGCFACIYFYAMLLRQFGQIHLAHPFYLEAAIRGNTQSMIQVIQYYNGIHYYNETKSQSAFTFQNFWIKIMTELGSTIYTNVERLADKKMDQSMCAHCQAELDYEDMTSKKLCGGCRYNSYCGKDCQRKEWKNKEDGGCNHMGECRQLKILKHHYKRYAKDIRETIIRGDDPKNIDQLQTLRTLLGLNQPKEDYEELLSLLSDDDTNDVSKSPNRYEYLTARKDGTVWIGSIPNVI